MSWTSTPNRLQFEGYYFRNAVAVIDDYKVSHTRNNSAMQRLIQNLFDREGRGRLTRDVKMVKTQPFLGFPLSTGEDPIDSSASNTARFLPMPWDGSVAGGTPRERVSRLQRYQKDFSMFTSALIEHIQRKDPEELINLHMKIFNDYADTLSGVANGPRISNLLALIKLAFSQALIAAVELDAINDTEAFRLLDSFDEYMEMYLVFIRERLKDKEPGKLFMEAFLGVLSSRKNLIVRNPVEHEIAGFIKTHRSGEADYVCILPGQAYSLVCAAYQRSVRRFPFSQESVAKDLAACGLISAPPGRSQTQVRWGDTRMYVWKMPITAFGLDDGQGRRLVHDTDSEERDG